MHSVNVDLDVLGRGHILIDDEDVSEFVHGMSIQSQPGSVTHVTLVVKEPLKFEGPCEVVQVPMGLSLSMLDSIPVEILHRKAGELPWGNSTELVANVLTVLKEMIRDASEPGERTAQG